ncbi:MAG: hypothetical protein P1U56_14585 [Saprospiraceae bacterium]|nr:hypothetical protein [Saprospiraceae bacterium]
MKYTCEIIVDVNREKCIELWLDERRLAEWQDGFQYKNWLDGVANENHAKAYILFEQNGRNLELEELIIKNQLPDYIEGKYTHVHMTNTQKVMFDVLDVNRTMIRTDVHYIQFSGFIPKIMGMLFPRVFKKQSQKWLNQFKVMAEN